MGVVIASTRPWSAPSAKPWRTTTTARCGDDFFRALLRRGFSTDDTKETARHRHRLGRYGELFDYDADSGELVTTEVYAALERATHHDNPGNSNKPGDQRR